MGLFGGGNSSSSTTTTSQSSGFSQVTGPALALQGSNNRISFTDQGAISAASAIAQQAFQEVTQASSANQATVGNAISAVAQASQGQAQSIILSAIKWGAVVLIAYVAARALGKVKG